MAILGFNEEEDNVPVIDSNSLAFTDEPVTLDTSTFDGFNQGSIGDVEASIALARQRQAEGANATLDLLQGFTGVDSNYLREFYNLLGEGTEEQLANWRPKYIDQSFMETDSKPGWIGETIRSQAGETGFIYAMGMLSNKLPGIAGQTVKWGTMGTVYNSMHAEALQEIARKSDKNIEDLTEYERLKAGFGAGINTFLEMVFPFGKSKSPVKLTGNVKSDLKTLENFVQTAKLKGPGALVKDTGKNVLKTMGQEGLTETAEGITTSALSDAGISYTFSPQGMSEALDNFVGGSFGGGVYGTPSSISQARQPNVQLREANKALEFENRQRLLEAGRDYREQYNKQASAVVGPIQDFDVTPELYKTADLPPTFGRNLANFAGDKLFKRATNTGALQKALNRSKTGKDINLVRNELFSMLGDVESFSGETQIKPSFDTLKNQYLGKYNSRFEKILQKWQRGVPLTGQMFTGVNSDVNAYIGAVLQDKANVAELRNKLQGKVNLESLDADILEIRKIQDEIYNELSQVLGESALKIGYEKDYLNRGLSRDAIKRDKEGFIKSLKEDVGYSQKAAEDIWNKIVNGKDPAVPTAEQIRSSVRTKGKDRAGFEKSRNVRWQKLNEKFREENALKSVQDYIVKASTRLASAQTFGGKNADKFVNTINRARKRGLLDKTDIQELWDMYDAEHRMLNMPQTPEQRASVDFQRALGNLTAIKLLGLATLSSIPELAWMPARVGFLNMMKAAPSAANYFLRGVLQAVYPGFTGQAIPNAFAKDVLQTMGLAMTPTVDEKITSFMAGDVNPFMNAWFRSPAGLFLTQYTNFVRAWTAVSALRMIQNEANKVLNGRLKGKNKIALERELRENGLTIEDFTRIAREGNGKIDFTNDAYLEKRFTKSDGTEVSIRDVLVPWVRKITTDVALEPRPTNRPLWMSNPQFQLVAQLKSFPVVFANNIMKRTYRQLNPKICTPGLQSNMSVLGSVAAAFGLAALVVELKNAIKGKTEDATIVDYVAGVGIPYIGTDSFSQAASIPALATLDSFFMPLFSSDGEGIADTAEAVLEQLVRTFGSAILAEDLGE